MILRWDNFSTDDLCYKQHSNNNECYSQLYKI